MTWLDLEMLALDVARSAAGLGANWFIQSTLLIATGLLIGAALRSRGSAVQSAVYRTTLVAVLVCPLMSWGLSRLGASGWSLEMPAAYTQEVPVEPSPADSEPTVDAPPLSVAAQSLPAPLESGPGPAVLQPPGDEVAALDAAAPQEFVLPQLELDPIVPEIAPVAPVSASALSIQWFGTAAFAASGVWMIASGWLLVRLASSWRKLIQIRRGAAPADAATRDACRHVASLLRVAPPDVLHSPYLPSPCLAGLRKPAILLPDADPGLPLRDILIHELAHLARGDCYWNLLRHATTALLFFQPLMWRLSRRLDSTAEEVCDDYVVEFGGDRREYAHRLVDIAELSIAPIAAAGVGIVSLRSMLAARVARIMDTSRSLSTRIGSLLLAIVLLAGLTATLLVGLVGVEPDRVSAEQTNEPNAPKDQTAADDPKVIDAEGVGDEDDDVITVRGQVIQPDGQPAAGADVYALRWYWNFGERKPLAQVKTDAQGRFEISYRKSQFVDAGRPDQWRETDIVAFAQGFGPGWVEYRDLTPGEEPSIRLVADDVPVEGRIIDLEGNPVAGATIEMNYLNASKEEDLSKWLAAVRAGQSVSTAFEHLGEMLPMFAAQRWQGITTDADGRFRMTGIGRERQVQIDLKHPRIVTQTLTVLTRAMDPIAHPAYGSTRSPEATVYGAQFEHAAAPSRPIEGIVKDAKTGEPIAGAEIWSLAFGDDPSVYGTGKIKTKTDRNGRYRLEGMPKSAGNEILVVPIDLPYFTARFEVPDPPGIEPAQLDLDLHRGVWVTGRVTDKGTGRGVQARVYYIVSPDNPLAEQLPEFRSAAHIIHVQDRYRTQADGSYRVVALPGHGIIGVKTLSPEFPSSQGFEEIPDLANRDAYSNYNMALTPTKKAPTAVKEVHIADNGQNVVCDFELDRGRQITIRVVDPAGAPLTGISAQGTRGLHDNAQTIPEAQFDILALNDDEQRTVLLHHEARALGKALRVKPADGQSGPLTVRLEPCATVTGRLVDGDGEPAASAELRIDVAGDGDFGRSLRDIATDADGRFRHDAFLPGLAYNIYAEGSNIAFTAVAKNLEVHPGETIDLGTIDVTSDKRPEPTRVNAQQTTNLPMESATGRDPTGRRRGTASHPEAPSGSAIDALALTTVRGRVVDDESHPIADARVTAAQMRWLDERFVRAERREVGETRTNADGQFSITVPKVEYPDPGKNRLASFDWKPVTITATAPGYAAAWLGGEWYRDDDDPLAGEVVLRLKKESPTIRGRLVNLEGQPQAGLSVQVMSLAAAEPGKVEAWLADVERLRTEGKLPRAGSGVTYTVFAAAMVMNTEDDTARDRRSAYFPAKWRLIPGDPSFPAPVRTRADGQFELAGLPPDCLAMLQVSGPGVATQSVSVVTRPMAKIDVSNTGFAGNNAHGYYGVEFDHPVAPGTTVFGTVTDAQSGEPLADVEVRGSTTADRMSVSEAAWSTRTDAEGRFRIEGLPIDSETHLSVIPTSDQPYLPTGDVKVPQSNAAEPIESNIKLRRGIIVRGKVTVAETGEPVDATVHYHPFLNNDFAKQYDRYDPRVYRYEGNDTRHRTAADGSFQAVVIPGRGILGVQAIARGEYCAGLGAEGIETGPQGRFPTYNMAFPQLYQRVLEIDVPPDANVREYNLTVSRGVSVKYDVTDPQGQPLSGVLASGVSADRVPTTEESTRSTIEFKSLRRGEKRRVLLMHRERRLGRVIDIVAPQSATSDAELQPVTLVPCGTVKGRLVNGEGEPVAGLTLAAYGVPMGDLNVISPQQAATDANGQFQLDLLPVGSKYRVVGNSPAHGSVDVLKEFEFEPGETIDLGTIDVTSDKRPEPNRVKPSTAAQSSADANAPDLTTVRGRVFGPNDKPAAGAHVAAIGTSNRRHRGGELDYDDDVLSQTTTDADGRFDLALDGVSSKSHKRVFLIARADGTGLAWRELDPDAGDVEASFELQAEAPIRGRLVDIEGQPADGVRLSVTAVVLAANEVWDPDGVGYRVFNTPPAAWPQPMPTGDDGGFAIHGVPPGHGVLIAIEASERFAPQELSLNTGRPEQRSENDGTYRSLVKNLQPGEEAVLALAPAQIFEGVVRYEDTGQPAPHARLTIWASQQEFGGSMSSVPGKADAEGRYRIIPKPGIRFGLKAYPPDGAPYLTRTSPEVDWDDGAKTREVDISLPRGVMVRGKIMESNSDTPMAGATVQYEPEEANNPHYADDILTGWQGIELSNERGEFEIVVLPGPGRLLVHGPNDDFVIRETSSRERLRGRPGGRRNYAHAIERIDPDVGSEPVEVKIELQRSAKITGQLVDETGSPVEEAILISQLNIWPTDLEWRGDASKQVTGGRFELTGMKPQQECTVYFLDAKRRLGAKANLVADGTSPIIVLKPCGRAAARFVDEEGQPRQDIRPTIHMVVTPGPHKLDREAADRGELAADSDFVVNIDRANYLPAHATDRDGRLVYPALIPGAAYQFIRYDDGKPSIVKEFSVEPGQEIDLGEIVLEESN
jgi:beta-lactamase regulating signal transducer with metallopeptidase domain/5-hydroxyisourate hydrolase-like protein (transthyretin family)